MDAVEIKTSLTLADWRAYQAQWAQRILGRKPAQLVGLLLGAGVIVAAASSLTVWATLCPCPA